MTFNFTAKSSTLENLLLPPNTAHMFQVRHIIVTPKQTHGLIQPLYFTCKSGSVGEGGVDIRRTGVRMQEPVGVIAPPPPPAEGSPINFHEKMNLHQDYMGRNGQLKVTKGIPSR